MPIAVYAPVLFPGNLCVPQPKVFQKLRLSTFPSYCARHKLNLHFRESAAFSCPPRSDWNRRQVLYLPCNPKMSSVKKDHVLFIWKISILARQPCFLWKNCKNSDSRLQTRVETRRRVLEIFSFEKIHFKIYFSFKIYLSFTREV